MTKTSPTLSRWTLGQMLVRLRLASNVNINEAARHLGVDRTTVQRWEHGQVAPKPHAVESLARLYGSAVAERQQLDRLARDAAKRGIWEKSTIPPELRVLYESENTAVKIHSVELEHIPGLLQTPEYLRAVQAALVPVDDEYESTIRDVRARRQSMLWSRDDLSEIDLCWVIGPAAIQHLMRLDEIAGLQIQRLYEAVDRGADIRVITGLHAAMMGSFTLIQPSLDFPPFAYIELMDAGRYVEDRDVVSQYVRVFSRVRTQSVPIKEYLT